MSALGSPSPLFLASAAAADTAANITKSVRFNSADSPYFNRTPSSAGNTKTWTWSGWVKYTTDPGDLGLFAGDSASSRTQFRFKSHLLDFVVEGATHRRTEAFFRDPSAWYHIVWAFDSTQSTASNRSRLYINGVEITDFSTNNAITQNATTGINSTNAQVIGATSTTPDDEFDGCMADVYLIDGQQLDCTSFGAFDASGVWQPAAYSGTYGTNGFHLFDFANESTVGHDSSGNNNDFTANNISTSDGTIASPTRFDWETADSGWSLSDSNYTATNTTSGYRQVYSEALNSSTTYHFVLSEKPGDNNGGWFFSAGTNVSNTHPDELGGDTLGLRTNETGIGTSGTFSNANGVSGGQNAITGFSDIQAPSSQISHSEWVINMTARKVWVRSFGSSSWIKGGDPTNSSSTPSFSLPTGTIYFGYVAYSSSETQVKLVTSVASVALGNDISFDVPVNGDQSDTGAGGEVSGNYCVWNPLVPKTYTLSNGNLDLDFVSGSNNLTHGTIAVSSGKWYWEVTFNSGIAPMIGIVDSTATLAGMVYSQNTALYYHNNGYLYGGMGRGDDATLATYGASYTHGDIIGVALDLDNGNINFYKNGVDQGVANQRGGTTYSIAGTSIFPAGGNGGGTANTTANFGQRAFAYSAPSGYKALCTTNLPTPTIADGSDYFDAKLWTGNGSTQTISGLEFSPDLVWIKSRSGAYSHLLFDQIRGTTKYLRSDNSGAEGTDSNSLTAFTSDGFSVGTTNAVNQNSGSLVAWAWDAGSSTVSNTDGSTTSSVRASQTAGFSIVSYTGNGSNSTIGHGLNAAPEMIMIKKRSASQNWVVYHAGIGATKALYLDGTTAAVSSSNFFQNTDPTSSVFSVGTGNGVNTNTETFIAYCFAPVSGYSQFGEYAGNSSTDGPFIHTNFRPAFLILKRYDTTSDWIMLDSTRDTFNAAEKYLYPHANGVEQAYDVVDFLSNGFKLRYAGGLANQTGNEYIYIAFAENPFQANGGLAR
jgi:hypothetical protein